MASAAVERVLSKCPDAKASSGGWMVRCPAHPDQVRSLSIGEGADGRALLNCHATCPIEAIVTALGLTMADLFDTNGNGNGHGPTTQIVDTYDYRAFDGTLLYQAVRYVPKAFRQRRPDGQGGWIWQGPPPALRVPYRLPELQGRETVFVVEGEKDCDRLWSFGIPATTNIGGAKKWGTRETQQLRVAGASRLVIIPDHDDAGRQHAEKVATSAIAAGLAAQIVPLPDLPLHGDVSTWLDAGHHVTELDALIAATPDETAAPPVVPPPDASPSGSDPTPPLGVAREDFYAYLPMHTYLFVPSRDVWPAASVNGSLPPLPLIDEDGQPVLDAHGRPKVIAASAWLDRHQHVEQMTWMPGRPMILEDTLVADGGWIPREGCRCFNLYRPPRLTHGDASQAGPWLDHLHAIYPDQADHLVAWLAHRVQFPHEKVNHALVLGGAQGIGKDTLLAPVREAVGPWNFADISPTTLLGRFNGFVKSVILRVNEAHDLGDVDRYAFYEHLKIFTAAPPDVLRVDEKHLREYMVWNVCGVIFTTNHKLDGLYLPADDRRHYVAWSTRTTADFGPDYWTDLYQWYAADGTRHVAAYLAGLDLAGFDPNAPPPKTPAFWDIVDSNRAPEDAELADVLELLDHPAAVTLADLVSRATVGFGEWLRDRKNSRAVLYRLEAAGYVAVRNPAAQSGLWRVGTHLTVRQVIYVRHELSTSDRHAAASQLAKGAS